MSHLPTEQFTSHLDQPRSRGTSRGRWLRILLLLGAATALSATACKPVPPPVRARSMAAALADRIPTWRRPQANQSDERRRFKDAPVYIDGQRVGVVRPLEAPANLKPRLRMQEGLPPAPRFSIAEYIEAAGGDLAKVREVHLYGGRTRVVIVPGDELRKHREDLLFSFTAGHHGKPRISWPPTGIQVNTRIDIVGAVAVYQNKAPPILERKAGFLHFGDGKEIEGIPYAPNEELKGTRFYADGKLLGWMKRKTLPNSLLMPGADASSGQFSLTAFVASLGVDPKTVRTIELVQDDDAVARLDGSALTREPPLAFTLPRRNQGNLVLALPVTAFQGPPPGAGRTVPVRISAVQLFLKSAPPKRTYAKPADVIDQEADREARDPGSKNDQADSEN